MPRKKRKPLPDPGRPWNEDEWEAFMKESDLRSARFGEILETVMDHPDRDALIDRHMGWDEPDEPDDAHDSEREPGFDPKAIMDQAAADFEAEKAERERLGQPPNDPLGQEEGLDDERRIPAYKLANEVGLRVHHALQPYMKARVPEDVENWDRDEIDERLGEAYIGCMIAAAKIIGGDAMGYEDEVLCGNIANCKRGLAGADQAEAALVWLREKNALPAELVDQLLPDVRAVQQAVRERIEELRKGVWWT
jgi:hypothetical protein